jgi:hypothetical protein
VDEFEIRSRAEYERALKRFSYPFEIVHGEEALDVFEEMKSKERGVPVILGGASEFTLVDEFMARGLVEHPSTQLILERASEISFPEGFQALKQRDSAMLRRRYPHLAEMAKEDGPPVGEWPERAPTGGCLTVTHHWSGEAWPRVHIAILPTDDWTTAPAYLRAGGWNDCPEAAVMVSALRSWRDRYGVELVGFSHDVMNIRAEIGPASREEALALAWEHYLFCSDSLAEQTLTELGAYLMAEDWWYFRWD